MVILDQSDSKAARFDPEISSMASRMINGVVDVPVVLETGLEDDVEFAQVAVVVILGPTDGCSERAERVTTFSA